MNIVLFNIWEITLTGWKLLGYLGVFIFASRWLIQVHASKKAGRPVLTRLFWMFSLLGSLLLVSYFIFGKNDSVGLFSNLFPAFIALYNLRLDIKYEKKSKM